MAETERTGVVKAPDGHVYVLATASEEVAARREGEARHRAGHVDVEWPPRHGPVHRPVHNRVQLCVQVRVQPVHAMADVVT